MEKRVQITSNVFIENLGEYSLVNFDRYSEEIENEGQTEILHFAEEQYKVKNPATYNRIIDQVLKEQFPDGESESALRKGITNPSDPDFIAFNEFAEGIKQKCRNEGIN